MSNEIAIRNQWSLTDVRELAKDVVSSKLFPGIDTVASATALMMLCQAEGMHPIQAMREYHIIEGRPSKRSMAILARFKMAGGKVQWHERSAQAAEATFTAADGDSAKVRWTVKEDAFNAGLTSKQNWQKHPRRMLTARVISEGVGLVAPQIVAGIGMTEELQDGEDFIGGEAGTGKPAAKPKQGAAKLAEFMAEPAPKPTEPLGGAAVVDAEYEEPPPPVDVTPAQMPIQESEDERKARGSAVAQEALAKALDGKKLQIPDLTTDRVPPDVMALSRKLVALPFAEQAAEMLAKQVGVLQKMAEACKDGDNRAVLTLVAAVAKGTLERKAAPQ